MKKIFSDFLFSRELSCNLIPAFGQSRTRLTTELTEYLSEFKTKTGAVVLCRAKKSNYLEKKGFGMATRR